MYPEDERLARLVLLLRRRSAQTQLELASAAGVPVRDVKRVEAGQAGDVRLGRIRSIFEATGGRARLVPWWNGAAADRLLDERHAAIVERVVAVLRARRWTVAVEVTFSEYGERGALDVLATSPDGRVAAVCEIKSVLGSLEETNRILDLKERLVPKIVFTRYGWRPAAVGRLLIVPRDTSVRRTIERHEATMRSVYPARSREVRDWLRRPLGPIRGIWFVSSGRDTTSMSK